MGRIALISLILNSLVVFVGYAVQYRPWNLLAQKIHRKDHFVEVHKLKNYPLTGVTKQKLSYLEVILKPCAQETTEQQGVPKKIQCAIETSQEIVFKEDEAEKLVEMRWVETKVPEKAHIAITPDPQMGEKLLQYIEEMEQQEEAKGAAHPDLSLAQPEEHSEDAKKISGLVQDLKETEREETSDGSSALAKENATEIAVENPKKIEAQGRKQASYSSIVITSSTKLDELLQYLEEIQPEHGEESKEASSDLSMAHPEETSSEIVREERGKPLQGLEEMRSEPSSALTAENAEVAVKNPKKIDGFKPYRKLSEESSSKVSAKNLRGLFELLEQTRFKKKKSR